MRSLQTVLLFKLALTNEELPLANQMRLVLHTGAYWLMLKLRDAIPRPQALGQDRQYP